ncbi:hypothetical protein ABFX02_02G177600 [Erythranthe guttata]|uniref:uncharacterized protein LOC105963917 n=1 Tax=Erythranthe guttata TaxID=4155 RepID=UPI00064E0E8F|nr:PREDICTED: uncharacterized protein LOC105963917 [Erythranthe guttata]|eukprot:XP_012843862.1 PREDICTED: uncharacterized protein LOC105963917 [Erythranthe guttata]
MDEECLNESKRRKIEDTVFQILRSSDLETTTELSVRAAAAERLGFGLSHSTQRRLVRQLVDSFLLSTAAAILCPSSLHTNSAVTNNNDGNALNRGKQHQRSGSGVDSEGNYDGKAICKLSDKRRVTVRDVNGTTMVSIRDFIIKDGNMVPQKGMCLTAEQWSTFRNNFPSIEEAIVKMESQLRRKNAVHPSDNLNRLSEAVALQSEAERINSAGDSALDRSQTRDGISNSKDTFHSPIERNQSESEAEKKQTQAGISTQGQSHCSVNAIHSGQLVPIQTARLDGRNYHSWRHQMEFFLHQLKIAYVLSEPCPSFDEKVKVKDAHSKWKDDDYLCRHSILSSLCDNLFQLHSQKSCSARELWEELKLFYEDFGTTKRSQINKYIHFEMADGVSILQQVEELHKMADSIIASGNSWIDEDFHVSVIVSKLPPSWKELRVRLMQEEYLPINVLMHRIQVEEESRKWCYNKESSAYYKQGRSVGPTDSRLGMRKRENRRFCHRCGKEGHVIKNCPDKKFDAGGKSGAKENEVLSSPPLTDNKMVDEGNAK